MNHKRKRIELSQDLNEKNTSTQAITNEDRTSIYVHKSTLSCAVEKNCIPCIYKLFPHGLQGLPSNIRFLRIYYKSYKRLFISIFLYIIIQGQNYVLDITINH